MKTLIFILTGLLISQLVSSQGWYDNSWPFRRAITVSNPNGSDQTEFQVLVDLNESNFDFSGHCQMGVM